MKLLSLLKRFAVTETMALSFVLALEALAYGAVRLVREFQPGAGDGYLVNINIFWETMAFSGVAVALLFGGPSYLVCARCMASKRMPYWIAGAVIVLGGTLFFILNLEEVFGGGCGGG